MLRTRTKRILFKIVSTLLNLLIAVFVFFLLWIPAKIFLSDIFPVYTSSMTPSIQPGDKIMVNKLIFGSRIYKNLHNLRQPRIETYRLKGFRGVAYNDVVAFNHAFFETKFNIGRIYVKRCIGMSGDTISIVNGIYRNSSIKSDIFRINYGIPTNEEFANAQVMEGTDVPWTIINFGPLYIPGKGESIMLNREIATIYARYIVYESGQKLEISGEQILLGGKPLVSYTFEENYYFMAGEDFVNSQDSRYFGLVPESFIIGIASRILFSKDFHSGKINWGRIWKKL